VDFSNRVRLNILFHLMTETASHHVDRCGVGIEDLRVNQEVWVLSRLLIAMEHYPRAGEEVLVKTWPRGIERLFALRDFLIYNTKGAVFGRATSNWLLLDIASRRPKRLERVFESMPVAPDQRALEQKLEKLPVLKSGEQAGLVEATYSQIDRNNHVNNAEYVSWILDAFTPEIHRDYYLSRLQINFLAETKFLDRITLIKEKTGKGEAPSFAMEGQRENGPSPVFQARLEWSPVIPK
jgi:acyl-ACP thioesterase